ncbi:hypothetical protein Bca52824_049539 [Brassica carinata]|uniref:Uncharacterized protein n=1 Tax=Brassica carinata TaxID=52824 RepID=A0A8X7URV5_BRACI|nr:hypothetical protein Bca52824_049539 [Brassica carinata]
MAARSLPDVPSSSRVVLRSAPGVASSSTAAPSSPLKIPSSSTVASNLLMVASGSISSVAASGSLLVKECGRDVEGTSLSLAVPSSLLSTEPCCDEVGLSSLDGEVAREQLSLLVRKMELADGRKSWSEIAESVIFAEVGTLTGSEAEDRVSASLIEEGTGFLFDEHGTNLVAESGVGGSKLSLKTLHVVSSLSSFVKKTMLETVREHEQMQLAKSFRAREFSSGTTNDRRDDDVENVDVEDDGALGSAGDEQNGTGDVNVDEESEQDEFASDGDHAANDSFGGEQSGVSGSLGIAVVGDGSDDGDGGSDRRADVTDILRKIKQESLAASLADSLDAFGDPCVYLKKKKRVRKANERPRSFIGPLVNHSDPSESFPSIVDEDTVKWISANCCHNGIIEARIPGEDERPWTVPDGLLLGYCDEHLIALAQLTPAAIRNIVTALFTAVDIGVHMSLRLFESITHITRCDKTDRAFYRKRKMLCWIKKFFYVRITPSSVPDVSDMSTSFRSSWNPYNGRHLAGVPLALGDSECVEYIKGTKAQDWTVVRRSEVWRCIPFIDQVKNMHFLLLACWRKMNLSEIPSLVDCFAGGSDDASVVESGQCTAGVEPSAPARSIVVGLTSTTAPVPPAGISGKEVVVAGSEKVVKKTVAGGRSFKDVPASKSRKVASSDVELPLVVESPAAEKATFVPFEHSFNGLSSGCGDLFKLFQSPGGVDGLPFDQVRRGEWYQEFACHLAIATKFANKLVVKAELEKTKAELASIKDKADNSEEMAALRGKYEAEKKVSSDALE